MDDPSRKAVTFRFYEELNDFLPSSMRKRDVLYSYSGRPPVKEAIEALGVPHVEVDLILANGISVDFAYRLNSGDRIAVYPVFEAFDISAATKLRPAGLREIKFALDIHLGKLMSRLRLLGFDCLTPPGVDDRNLVDFALRGKRIILTRDRQLLKRKEATHGYFVRSTDARSQTAEVIRRFDLSGAVRPFMRCTACNSLLEPLDKSEAQKFVLPRILERHDRFNRCPGCRRIYWPGTHYQRLTAFIENLRNI